MYLLISAVSLAEVAVLLASAVGALLLIARAIFRAIYRRDDATTKKPSKEDLLHLKRAGSGFPG